jgi:hypothetical protein
MTMMVAELKLNTQFSRSLPLLLLLTRFQLFIVLCFEKKLNKFPRRK